MISVRTLLLSVSLFVLGQTDCSFKNQLSNEAQSILQSLQEYKPQARWICRDCMLLNAHEAAVVISTALSMLSEKDKRCSYFSDSADCYDDAAFKLDSLKECMFFDRWLQSTFVDRLTLEMISKEELLSCEHSNSDVSIEKERFALCAHYMEQVSDTTIKNNIYRFYAFYFDCCSWYFTELVIAASGSSSDEFSRYMKSIMLFYEKLRLLAQRLRQFPLYADYQLKIKTYREIIDLLKQERITS